MRLIDADALMKKHCKEPAKGDCKNCDWYGDSWCRCEIFGVQIADALTIEAEPVRHGRVIVHDGFEDEYYEYCSECESRDVHIGDNYCPNCGAKMDGESE